MCDLLTDPYLDELRKCAPSDHLCTAGVSRNPSPMASPGGTGTTRKTWRDLLFTMLAIQLFVWSVYGLIRLIWH